MINGISGISRAARQLFAWAVVLTFAGAAQAAGQQVTAPANGAAPPAGMTAPAGVTPPADYVIGPEDVLTVVFWREKDLSADAAVRPDGMISLPLLNDVQAAGLTPEALRVQLTEAATKFIADPTVTVVVKEIHSRKVYITGMVAKPGPYPLTAPTTVIQLLAMAGGVHEFADAKNISILRVQEGKQVALPFNYRDVSKRKNLQQNIELRPGDTVVVP